MIDTSGLIIFMIASLALLLAPGPAVLYIVARSIEQGRLAGIVSAAGISLGGIVHVVAAALGLSAVLVSSALAFTVVKYLGAAYLIYLGIRTLMSRAGTRQAAKVERQALSHIFRQGVIVNILNPKTALFFFAFLPQFVDPTRASVALQISLLGTIFLTMALVTDLGYALVAGTVGQWLKKNARFLAVQKYLSAGIYIFLGVSTALLGNSKE